MNRLTTTRSAWFALACGLGLIGCGDSNAGHQADAGIVIDAAPQVDAASDTNTCSSNDAGVCCSSTDCSGATPTCDTTTHACRACTGDGDCASTVCDLETGACLAADNVVYAAPAGSETAACTQQAPCTIARAFEIAATPRDTIKLEPGAYTSSIVVTTPKLTIHGFGATWTAPAGGRSLKLDNRQGAPEHHLRIEGVSFVEQTSGAPISCTSFPAVPATLELDRVSIDVPDAALDLLGCTGSITRSAIRDRGTDTTMSHAVIFTAAPLTIDRTRIEGSYGITAYAPGVVITNSVIAASGTALLASTLGESGAGTFQVSFSTILTSHLACSRLQLDNSIVVNPRSDAPADTIDGAACTVKYTTVFPQTAAVPGDNNKVGVDPMLKDPAAGDYHLKTGSPAIDAADPAATLAIDFEGTSRPQGAHSDMGAFERAP